MGKHAVVRPHDGALLGGTGGPVVDSHGWTSNAFWEVKEGCQRFHHYIISLTRHPGKGKPVGTQSISAVVWAREQPQGSGRREKQGGILSGDGLTLCDTEGKRIDACVKTPPKRATCTTCKLKTLPFFKIFSVFPP